MSSAEQRATAIAEALLANGFCLVTGAMPPREVEAIDRDLAPSFENTERGLKVFVDYANYADRESGRSQRFCVSRYDEEAGDFEDVALSTNDWAEVTRFLTA